MTYLDYTPTTSYWWNFNEFTSANLSAPKSYLNETAHREYLYTRAIHTIDDLLTDRAALNRAALRAIDFLSTALHALDKNKPHITADLVQRTLDDLLGATSAQRTFDH